MQDNLRMTKQRKIILDELSKVETHPTAYELCDMVRQKLPRISLGTVYRNLEILSKRGDILKIEGDEMRFDGRIEQHYHLRCNKCGAVEDVHIPVIDGLEELAQQVNGGKIHSHHLEFTGFCKNCC